MRVLIVGAGVSGVAALRFCLSENFYCAIYQESELSDEVAELTKAEGIEHFSSIPENLSDFDTLCLSPGFSLDHPIVLAAKNKNIEITNDINLARKYYDGNIVGITGTNGKSTVVSLLAHLFNQHGSKAAAVGNIGLSPLQTIVDQELNDVWSMELSSYQLETVKDLSLAAGIFTSFAPDHLSRHGTIQAYFEAKWRLVEQIRPGGLLVLRPHILEKAEKYGLKVPAQVKLEIVETHDPELSFLGENNPNWHQLNLLNLSFCLRVLRFFDQSYQFSKKDILSFEFLPCRYQIVEHDGSGLIINDSKATNVEATVAALEATKGPLYLLLGGAGKGESYKDINAFSQKIKHVLCFGESRSEIAQDLKDCPNSSYTNLAAAIASVKEKNLSEPATILFSPACASFDEFKNYLDRGAFFTKAIQSS